QDAGGAEAPPPRSQAPRRALSRTAASVPTRWIEISISVPTAAAEVLADAVGALTGGVEIRDTETIIRVEGGRSLILAQCAPELEAAVTAETHGACARLPAAGRRPRPASVARREA